MLELDCESMFRWIDGLEKLSEVEDVAMYGNKLHVTVADPVKAEAAIRRLEKEIQLKVISIREITPSLEDIFVSVMSHEQR